MKLKHVYPAEYLAVRKRPTKFRGALVLAVSMSLFVTMACSQLSRDECLNMNWHAIGLSDGEAGTPPSSQNEYLDVCSDYAVEIDRNSYNAGYQAGISTYCTRAKGFDVGRRGDEYLSVCPLSLESDFLTGWNSGHELWTASEKVRSAERRRLTTVVKTLGPEVRDDRQSREIESSRLSEKQRKQVLDGTDGPHFGTGVGPQEYEYASRVSKIDRLISVCIEVQKRVAALGFDVEDACN